MNTKKGKRKKQQTNIHQPIVRMTAKGNRFIQLISWLGGAGFFILLASSCYDFFYGSVDLEFKKPFGRGYVFSLKNNSPVDYVINEFRIIPPTNQQVIYISTESVYAKITDKGLVLPGGNIGYVPAADFKELDGRVISARSETNFRIPPMASEYWLEPTASIVDIKYKINPKNSSLAVVDKFLTLIGSRPQELSIRYLITENYWSVTNSTSLHEAIRLACRDNPTYSHFVICK